jgi:hypothetical protein
MKVHSGKVHDAMRHLRAIGLLQDQGIVAATTEAKSGRVFCAKAILDILEEPARLTPVLPPQSA